MTDAEVAKQLDNMVSFIKKEAEEKASEIFVKAEEEFTIQKAKLVQTEKKKIIDEFARKEKQADTARKMYAEAVTWDLPRGLHSPPLYHTMTTNVAYFSIYSNELNRARLEKLRAQQKQVDNVVKLAAAKLPEISASPAYKDLVPKLILQVRSDFVCLLACCILYKDLTYTLVFTIPFRVLYKWMNPKWPSSAVRRMLT